MGDFLQIIEKIVMVSLPAVITAFVTWNISVHNSRNNDMKNNYKIVYNRVYYQLNKELIGKKYRNINHIEFQKNTMIMLKKYDIYIPESTKRSFRNYCEDYKNDSFTKRKSFKIFYNNVMDYNYKIRLKIGYLSDGFFTNIKYMPVKIKNEFWCTVIYLLFGIMLITYNIFQNVTILLFCYILIVLLAIFFLKMIVNWFLEELYETIKKTQYFIKNCVKKEI